MNQTKKILDNYIDEQYITDMICEDVKFLNHIEKNKKINKEIKNIKYEIKKYNTLSRSYCTVNKYRRVYFYVKYDIFNFSLLFTRDTNIIDTYIKTINVKNINDEKIPNMLFENKQIFNANFSEYSKKIKKSRSWGLYI